MDIDNNRHTTDTAQHQDDHLAFNADGPGLGDDFDNGAEDMFSAEGKLSKCRTRGFKLSYTFFEAAVHVAINCLLTF